MNKQPITVFLADDHPIVAEGIQALLLSSNTFKFVGYASSSPELLRVLPAKQAQVLLLDLNMPGSDCFYVIQQLLKLHPWVRILAFTGYDSAPLAKSVLAAGAQGFLVKTAAPSEILKAIQLVSEGHTYLSADLKAERGQEDGLNESAAVNDDFRKRLGLSKREQEVLVLISKGLTSQRIAQTLFISKYTVETHRKNILRKLDLNSSTELVKFAIQQGLVQ